MLEGDAQARTPRLPPTIEGEADSSRACRSWKGCGWKRETQSTAFLSTPGIEALYSGEQITNASVAFSRRRSSSAAAGNLARAERRRCRRGSRTPPSSRSRPFPRCSRSRRRPARQAACSVTSPQRGGEDEEGNRLASCASIVAISPERGVVGPLLPRGDEFRCTVRSTGDTQSTALRRLP